MEHVWGLLVGPEEQAVRSKTQRFDESVLLDWEELPSLGRWLEKLKQHNEGVHNVWGATYNEYVENFKRVAEVSGVAKLGPHPYALRHGGAAYDYLRGRRRLDAVRV